MSTTVDDLIDLKDMAVAACRAAVAGGETGESLGSYDMQTLRDAIKRSELYDAAEEDDTVCSIEEYEEREAEPEFDGPSCERCGVRPAATCECDEATP